MKIDDSERPITAEKAQKTACAAPTLSLLMPKLSTSTKASGVSANHPHQRAGIEQLTPAGQLTVGDGSLIANQATRPVTTRPMPCSCRPSAYSCEGPHQWPRRFRPAQRR